MRDGSLHRRTHRRRQVDRCILWIDQRREEPCVVSNSGEQAESHIGDKRMWWRSRLARLLHKSIGDLLGGPEGERFSRRLNDLEDHRIDIAIVKRIGTIV